MTDRDDKGFLARWSERKIALRKGEIVAETVAEREPADDRGPSGATCEALGEPDPSIDPASLPSVEELTAESDITVFLRRGVPQELQRLALRKAWSLDPSIRSFIEVAENQYDWNAVDGVPGFGELPAGTNIEALLAQATGALPPPPPAEVAVPATSDVVPKSTDAGAISTADAAPHCDPPAASVPGSGTQPGVPTTAQPPLATGQPPADHHAQLPPPVSGASSDGGPDPVGPEPTMAPASRRRHGGALPA